MEGIIVGNVCSLLAMVSDTVSSSRKTARGVLLVQLLSQIFYGVGAIVLKGYSAAVQNAVSIIRNLEAVRQTPRKVIQWLCIAAGVGLGLAFNNLGWLGLLPVAANLVYSLAVFAFPDDEWKLKAAFFINIVMYTVFNFAIWNIVGGITNGTVAVMTAIFLIKGHKKQEEN